MEINLLLRNETLLDTVNKKSSMPDQGQFFFKKKINKKILNTVTIDFAINLKSNIYYNL